MERDERIESKLDKIVEHIGSIDITLAKQEESLRMHMKRSDSLENQFEELKKFVYEAKGALAIIGGILVFIEFISKIM